MVGGLDERWLGGATVNICKWSRLDTKVNMCLGELSLAYRHIEVVKTVKDLVSGRCIELAFGYYSHGTSPINRDSNEKSSMNGPCSSIFHGYVNQRVQGSWWIIPLSK